MKTEEVSESYNFQEYVISENSFTFYNYNTTI